MKAISVLLMAVTLTMGLVGCDNEHDDYKDPSTPIAESNVKRDNWNNDSGYDGDAYADECPDLDGSYQDVNSNDILIFRRDQNGTLVLSDAKPKRGILINDQPIVARDGVEVRAYCSAGVITVEWTDASGIQSQTLEEAGEDHLIVTVFKGSNQIRQTEFAREN